MSISWPLTTVVSLPKIAAKSVKKISGRTTVKNTDAGSRQNCFWS